MKNRGILIFFFFLFSVNLAFADLRDKVSQYVYSDTKQLVFFVENAAALLENDGPAAFKAFDKKNSRWWNNNYYLFVYDVNGKCVFHPIEPSLVGKNLLDFKDINGRPVIKMITKIGKKPAKDASGWVFYKWEDPWQSSFPQWKCSYIRKVMAPDKNIYLIGCGLYDMKIEKAFIEQQTDKAIEMLFEKGPKKGFESLRLPWLNFDVMDSYISVINAKGEVVVSPNFPSINVHRNLLNMIDKSGKNIGQYTMLELKKKDRIWISYLWPKNESEHLARKLAYIRKITLDNQTYYVIMDFFPALPIWMK